MYSFFDRWMDVPRGWAAFLFFLRISDVLGGIGWDGVGGEGCNIRMGEGCTMCHEDWGGEGKKEERASFLHSVRACVVRWRCLSRIPLNGRGV